MKISNINIDNKIVKTLMNRDNISYDETIDWINDAISSWHSEEVKLSDGSSIENDNFMREQFGLNSIYYQDFIEFL